MAKFLDGPAAGVRLMLHRAPIMLRVVCNKTGEWDALDQPSDEPAAEEQIFLYMMVTTPSRFHLCRSPRKLSGWYEEADYRLFSNALPDVTLRSSEQWHKWCAEHEELLRKAFDDARKK